MDDWVLWLIAAVVFGVGEIATLGFFLAPFAGGALAASLVAAVGPRQGVSWAVFLVASVACCRAAAARALAPAPAPSLRTGTAALVGKSAMVVERIDAGQRGCVRLEGEMWTARAYDDDDVIEAGERVQVIEIRGATALVTK